MIMETDKSSETIVLKDGRKLAYAEWGDPAGKPVFHFHGSSGSRLERPPDEKVLTGIRLITIDRPGHGLSDFKPGYRLLDWPDDVTALADHLGINKFAVEGWSFGGPYAIACALVSSTCQPQVYVVLLEPSLTPSLMVALIGVHCLTVRLPSTP